MEQSTPAAPPSYESVTNFPGLPGYLLYKVNNNQYWAVKRSINEGTDPDCIAYILTVDVVGGKVTDCTCKGYGNYHRCKHSRELGNLLVPQESKVPINNTGEAPF